MASAPVTKDRRLALAMACTSLAATCMFGGYELARGAGASIFIAAYGASGQPWAMAIIPLPMAVLIYAYGYALTRLGSLKALMLSLGFSAVVLAGCHAALRAGVRPAAALVYVFSEIYVVILVEQLWAFIDSSLDEKRARLYNGLILGGAALGPIVGGAVLSGLAVRMGSEVFMLLAGAALVPTMAFSYAAFRLVGEPRPPRDARASTPVNLRLVLRSRVLLLVGAVVALTQVFSTTVTLRFHELLENAIPDMDHRSAYLGSFWAGTNTLAAVLQLIVVPLLLRRLPLALLLVGIPAVHLLASTVLLAHPSLWTASMCLMLFKGMDYSLFRATKELLYIPLSFDARYRAKQVVDSFVYRLSKSVTAGVIAVVRATMGVVPSWTLPGAALGAALSWLVMAQQLSAASSRPPGPP